MARKLGALAASVNGIGWPAPANSGAGWDPFLHVLGNRQMDPAFAGIYLIAAVQQQGRRQVAGHAVISPESKASAVRPASMSRRGGGHRPRRARSAASR